MNDLLKFTIDAHGGLDAWRQFTTVSAHTHVGGELWGIKGHAGEIKEVDVIVNLLEQKVSHIPNDQWHTMYSPDRIAIETGAGDLVEELYNPRASFKGHNWDTSGPIFNSAISPVMQPGIILIGRSSLCGQVLN